MIVNLIGWVFFGLIAGAIARFLHPGYERMGIGGTMALGILGSLLGGGIAYMLKLGIDPYQPSGWIMSIVGAIVLLVAGVLGTKSARTQAP